MTLVLRIPQSHIHDVDSLIVVECGQTTPRNHHSQSSTLHDLVQVWSTCAAYLTTSSQTLANHPLAQLGFVLVIIGSLERPTVGSHWLRG